MMSKHNALLRIILLVILLFMLPTGLAACKKAPPASAPVAPSGTPAAKVTASPLTVLSITGGDVLVMKPGDKEWSRGTTGMTLGVDYKIKTQSGGKAAITFFEGSVIELEGNTEITLADLGMVDTTTTIKLKQAVGETISRVKKLADQASSYEIETRAATTAVRGSTVYNAVAENGTTIVGNIDGSMVVIAQGKETVVPEGKHVTVEPGEPPGEPEPGAIPGKIGTLPPTTQPPTTVPPPVITITSALNKTKVFNGDTVTITYTVSNTGAVPVSDVSLIDDKVGLPAYAEGDKNGNSILDPGETWVFKADYMVPANATGTQIAIATLSGAAPDGKTVTKSVQTMIDVTVLVIKIISPNMSTVVTDTVRIVGSVNDPSVTEVTVNHNGVVSKVIASSGYFSVELTMMSGANTITITATRPGGASANALIELQPVDNRSP